MRLVVLALALALVAGHQNLAPSFAPGNTYVYKYEAKIMGGLPEQDLAKAGLKLTSRVKISAVQENVLLLKLENPEVYEYSDVWPKNSFSQTQLRQDLEQHLRTPIKFKYEQGIVGEILAPTSVPTQVINIHRGILNVFQLNIKQTQNVYELQEEGTQGVCKTQYAITEDEKADQILLTKSRDLHHCHEKVMKDVGLAYTKKCEKCQEVSRNLRGTTGYNYRLKKNQEGILIEEASGDEIIQYSPFNELNGAATMQTRQHLVLVQVERVPTVPINAEYRFRGSLKYEFSSEHLQAPINLMKMSDVNVQVASLLNHLVEDNRERVQEDAPLKFLELIQLLRAADREQLQTLLKSHSHQPQRRWLLDAIPHIGTEAALEIVMDKILKKEVSVPEAVQLVIGSLHSLEATSEIIQKVWNFAQEPSLKQETYGPTLRKALLLGVGSLIHRHCSEKSECHDVDIKRLQQHIENASDPEEMILLTKVMANAGHHWSYKAITKLLPIHGTEGSKLPKKVHIAAILALRELAKNKQKEVQNQALQLYMDQTLDPELRILSVMVLFETKPSMAVVTNVVNVIKSDRSQHVADFAHSLIKSLARNIGSVHQSIVAECNVALRLLSQRRMNNNRLTRVLHLDYFHKPLTLGGAATVYYINDASSSIPKAIMAKSRGYISGAAADVLEVGVRAEGIRDYITKIQKNLDNSDNSDSANKMRRILNALSNWKSLPSNEMLASMHVKVLGQEIAFAEVDKRLIEDLVKNAPEINLKQEGMRALHALFQNGINTRLVKAMLPMEIRRIMPTAAGLPMELSLYTAAITSADIHARIHSNLQQDFQLSDLLNAKTDIESEIKPSIAVNTFAVMGVNSPLAQTAMVVRAKVKVNTPAKIATSLNFAESNFKISALPVNQPENVAVGIEVETQAVAINTARKTPLISNEINSNPASATSASREYVSDNVQVQDRPDSRSRVSEFDKKFCTKSIRGLKSCLRIATHNARFIRDSALYRLVGKHLVHLSFKQSEDEVIEKLEMELQLGAEGAKKLLKTNSLNLEEVYESTPALSKLQSILSSGLKNASSSSSSSSSSHSSHSSHSTRSTRHSHSSHSSSKSGLTRRVISAMGKLVGGKVKSSESSSSRSSHRSRQNQKNKSTVSSVTSLFSSSSSSRSQSHRQSQQTQSSRLKFAPNHIKATSHHQSGSKSLGKSLEKARAQKKFLGDSRPTLFVLILRAVKANNQPLGYEIAAYKDEEQSRVQVIMAAQAPENHWRLVTDAMVLSNHKAAAKIAWGDKELKYSTLITGETGQVDDKMAARVRMAWKRLPSSFVKNVKMIYQRILVPYLSSANLQKRSEEAKQISLTMVIKSEKMLNVIFKSPLGVYRRDVQLHLRLPIQQLKDQMPFDAPLHNVHYLLAKAYSVECKFERDHITTFNNWRYRVSSPHSCYQLLAQECSNDPEFIVLLKKESEEDYVVNVKVQHQDYDLTIRHGRVTVKVNEQTIPIDNLPYTDTTNTVRIKVDQDQRLVFSAPKYGISDIIFNRNSVKIEVVDRMRNKVCGLCGQGNGDHKSDYRKPDGRMAEDSISFAHSWTLPAKSCQDQSGCRVTRESIVVQKKSPVHGVQSECENVDPVLRCMQGCVPTRTQIVNIGFHCKALGDNSRVSESERSIDLREKVETHLQCQCSPQCA